MKTDDLIRTLAADTMVDRRSPTVLAAGLIPALVLGAALLWVTIGFRHDLLASLGSPVSAARFVLTGALGLIGAWLAILLARPEGRDKARLWPLAAIAAAALGLVLWAYLTMPAEGRQMAFVGKTMTNCLLTIPLLSVLPVAAVLLALRKGATTAPALGGFAAGVAGSGFAAMVYALHCTEDSPLFYVTWYGVAISGVILVSTLVGSRFLRW